MRASTCEFTSVLPPVVGGWRRIGGLRCRAPCRGDGARSVMQPAKMGASGRMNLWTALAIRPRANVQVVTGAVPAKYVGEGSGEVDSDEEGTPEEGLSPQAAKNLAQAAWALRRYGSLGFWSQLALSLTSAVVLVFSVAFTNQGGPLISTYTTLFGVIMSFVSTFKSSGYVRLGRRLKKYLEAPQNSSVKTIKKSQVLNSMSQGVFVNIMGLGTTIVGLQAAVGVLLAKTLTNTTANPFLAGGTGSWNPVLAFDVFLLQASTNTILSHFIGLAFTLWMVARLRDKNLVGLLLGN